MPRKSQVDHATISERSKDTAGIQAALKPAARDAVQEHARAGQKIVVWRDNQVVWEDPQRPGNAIRTDH